MTIIESAEPTKRSPAPGLNRGGSLVDPEAAARYRERGWWRDNTLLDDFARCAARHPDKVAIVSHHVATGRAEVLSFRHVRRLADRFAAALFELGIRPGDVVSFQLPNWWHVPVLHLACARIGAVANPITPILRSREVAFLLERVAARVCVVPEVFRNFDHAEMLAEIRARVPTLERVFVLGGGDRPGTESFEAFFCDERWEERHPPDALEPLRASADSVAQIMFTSGTTGEAKGVVHSHNTLDIGVRSLSEPLALGADDVVLMFSPIGHQTGYLYGVCMPLMYGMKVVYQDIWHPATMLRLVQDEQVTWTMGTTTFVLDACAAAGEGTYDLSSLRAFTCAGAPVPPKAVHEARGRLGTTLLSAWGMTEVAVGTTTVPGDSDERVSTSDGRPPEWVQVRIADPDGEPLPPGVEGRLLVRTPSQHLAYYERPDLYEASLVDGWFDTGDLARVDSDGYVRITGRTKDLIIRGGENIPVVEIEALIYEHPQVHEVAVVPYHDERLGERVCAVVVPSGNDPPTLEDLTGYLSSLGVAKHFWPERLEVRSALPKTASGKIQKFVLREELAGPGERAAAGR